MSYPNTNYYPTYYTTLDTPIGPLRLVGDGARLTRLELPALDGSPHATPPPPARPDAAPFAAVIAQITSYFAGERMDFDLPLAPLGTPFQRQVWDALLTIPFGQTTSYGAIAVLIGSPGSARAVGLANNRNPLPLVIPCHRVVGSTGALVGYGGGLGCKRWLLEHEARVLAASGAAEATSTLW